MRSLRAPGIGRLVLACAAAALVLLALMTAGMTELAVHLAPSISNAYAARILPWIGGIGSLVLAWFLLPSLLPLFLAAFSERIIILIEKASYPRSLPRNRSAGAEMLADLRFGLLALLLNVLVLPLYLVPVVNLAVFYTLNGYLLGREFFVIAARRHLPPAEVEILRRRNSGAVLISGLALAWIATIPLLNLVAPLFGIALMVHLFHALAAENQHTFER